MVGPTNSSAGRRGGLADADTMLSDELLMPGHGRPGSRRLCGGDRPMYNDNMKAIASRGCGAPVVNETGAAGDTLV